MTIEKLTDMEIALELASHIKNPCEVNVEGQTHNIRSFYLRLAKETALKLINRNAGEFLESVAKMYE